MALADHECVFTDKLNGRVKRFSSLGTGRPRTIGTGERAVSLRRMADDKGGRCRMAEDRFSVQFKDGVDTDEIHRVTSREGSEILERHRTPGYVSLSVPCRRKLGQAIQRFVEFEQVAFAEPAYFQPDDKETRRQAHWKGNATDLHSKQWNLRNSGQLVHKSEGRPGADISAAPAWTISKGSSDVVIVVIDKGFDLEHPVLRPNQYPRGEENWNFQNDDEGSPQGGQPHGTQVAGIACADDSSQGIVGVSPLCRFVPLRARLDGFYTQRVDALQWVARKASRQPETRFIVNCSWGISADVAGIRNAIGRTRSPGNVLFIASAGNENRDLTASAPVYPAEYPEVVSVGATDHRDQRWQEDEGIGSNFGKVDVCAPGYAIWTTTSRGKYTRADGTSMSAPHVAGAAALVWSVNPGLSPERVRAIIEDTCDGIDHLNPDFAGQLGRGRINAFRAASEAQKDGGRVAKRGAATSERRRSRLAPQAERPDSPT